MEEELRAHLTGDAAVTALVGDRVHWAVRPQTGALPAVVLHRITGRRDQHMQGRSGLVDSLVQMDCWAGTFLEARNLAQAVVAALDTLTFAPFQRAFVQSERSSFEPGAGPQGAARTVDFHRTSLDVRVWHSED